MTDKPKDTLLQLGEILTPTQLRKLYFDPMNRFGSAALEHQVNGLLQSWGQTRDVESAIACRVSDRTPMAITGTNDIPPHRVKELVAQWLAKHAFEKAEHLESALSELEGLTQEQRAELAHLRRTPMYVDKRALIDIIGVPEDQRAFYMVAGERKPMVPPTRERSNTPLLSHPPAKDWGVSAEALKDMGLTYGIVKNLPDTCGFISLTEFDKRGLLPEQIAQLPQKGNFIDDYSVTAGIVSGPALLAGDYGTRIAKEFPRQAVNYS